MDKEIIIKALDLFLPTLDEKTKSEIINYIEAFSNQSQKMNIEDKLDEILDLLKKKEEEKLTTNETEDLIKKYKKSLNKQYRDLEQYKDYEKRLIDHGLNDRYYWSSGTSGSSGTYSEVLKIPPDDLVQPK